MADLPLNGRNYIDLSLLQPGVAEYKAVNKTLTGNVGTYFVSNGGTVRSNLYLLDGAILTNILNAELRVDERLNTRSGRHPRVPGHHQRSWR